MLFRSLLQYHKREVLSIVLLGYGVVVWVSEWFLDQKIEVHYASLTFVQWIAILFIISGTLLIIYQRKWGGNNESNTNH